LSKSENLFNNSLSLPPPLSFTEEYFDLLGTRLSISNDQLVAILAKCPGVTRSYSTYCQQNVYHYNSPQTAHISNMNKSSAALKQKIARPMNKVQQRPRYVPPFRRQTAPPPLMQPILETSPKLKEEPVREVPPRLVEKPQAEDIMNMDPVESPVVPVMNGDGLYRQEVVTESPPAYQEELQPVQESNKEGFEPTAIDDPNYGSIAAQYHKVKTTNALDLRLVIYSVLLIFKFTSNFCGRELIGDDFFLSCFAQELGHQQLFGK
jgi:hypothetical protein